MSIACSKQYTMNVNIPIPVTAYWKMDEAAGSVPRIDSVGVANLSPSGITDIGVPGLISNAMRFDSVIGSQDYNTFPAFASLGHVIGDSFSFFGWVKLDATGLANVFGGPGPFYTLDVGHFIRFRVGSSLSVTPWRIDSFSDTVFVSLTLSTWHFFFFFWDAGLQQWGYSFDNGPQSLLPTVQPIGAYATGRVFVQNGWVGGPTGTVYFDEMGFVKTQKLSLSQLAFLYNGGTGRTYPF